MQRLITYLFLALIPASTGFSELFFQPGQSAAAMGTAYSSAPAGTEDCTMQFYNPASSGFQHCTSVAALPTAFFTFNSFENGSAENRDGTALSGTNEQNIIGTYRIGGAAYASYEGHDWFHLHMGITTPWQMDNAYKDTWIGRYYGIRNTIESVNFAPGFSIRSKNIVIGFSAQIDYLYNKMQRAIDFGLIAEDLGIVGALPSQQDGLETLSGQDWAYGWALGIMVDMCCNLRLGAGYRSELNHNLTAIPDYVFGDIGDSVAANTGAYLPVCATWNIDCPSLGWVGFQYDWNEELLMFFSVNFRGWSNMSSLIVSYPDNNQADEVTKLGFKDTLGVALGFNYNCECDLIWRFGAEYLQSPTDNPHPFFYGDEQIKVGVGAGYWLYHGICKIDAGYTHSFIRDFTLYRADGGYRGSLTGVIDPSENEFSLQVSGRF